MCGVNLYYKNGQTININEINSYTLVDLEPLCRNKITDDDLKNNGFYDLKTKKGDVKVNLANLQKIEINFD